MQVRPNGTGCVGLGRIFGFVGFFAGLAIGVLAFTIDFGTLDGVVWLLGFICAGLGAWAGHRLGNDITISHQHKKWVAFFNVISLSVPIATLVWLFVSIVLSVAVTTVTHGSIFGLLFSIPYFTWTSLAFGAGAGLILGCVMAALITRSSYRGSCLFVAFLLGSGIGFWHLKTWEYPTWPALVFGLFLAATLTRVWRIWVAEFYKTRGRHLDYP